MKALFLLLAATIVISITACNKDDGGTMPQPTQLQLTDKAGQVILRSNAFGTELFRQTAIAEPEKNLMLSPLSASVALTMLLNGSNGDTYDQLREMLDYQGLTTEEINAAYQSLTEQLLTVDPDVEIALANAVWYRQGFQVKPPFLATMQDQFDARTEALDFSKPSALDVINGWAADNTNGKIPKVLNEIDPAAVMFLMNALYFKGTWTWQFDKSHTAFAPFKTDNGQTTDTEMMNGDIPSRTHSGNGYNAIELYYGKLNFSMIIIVPAGTVADLLEGFDEQFWSSLTNALDILPGDPTEIPVSMPKFTFEYEKELNDQLKAMGMTDAFDPSKADLSGISDADIYVDFVKQNTFVNVDEEGTEAAAVTTVGIYETSIPEPFTVDKSFLFAIRERTTNTLLFIGKVMKP